MKHPFHVFTCLEHRLWVNFHQFNIRKYNDCTATSVLLSLICRRRSPPPLPYLFNYKFQK